MALERIKVRGFKSIRELDFEVRPINVLIGANGSGKSNFLGVLPLIHAVRLGRAERYSALRGGAERALHFGSRRTSEIGLDLLLTDGLKYSATLTANDEDRLVTTAEAVSHDNRKYLDRLFPTEEELVDDTELRRRLAKWRAYQFHDTSRHSPMRTTQRVADSRCLRSNGANLAPFLHRLRRHHNSSYRRIRDVVRMAAPFLLDFVLEPDGEDERYVRLEWEHAESEAYFDVASLSDGTLRFVALMTLLHQPVNRRPDIIVIDEPELGLHPFAIGLLAEAVQAASHDSKVILATQSPMLVDYFEPEHVVVVDLVQGASEFRRLDNTELAEWLEDYSLGEL